MRRSILFASTLCFSVVGFLTAPVLADPPPDSEKDGAAPLVEKLTLGHVVLKGTYSEAPKQPGLFGELEESLRAAIARLDKAAGDPKIKGLILRIENPTIGRGKVHELRAAIGRLRKAGKKVYAQLDMAMLTDYLIATACDEIIMPPSGTLLLPGVRAEVSFYKNLFEMVGIQADMMQVGDYKGAAEPYTRTEMSPELREEMRRLVDDHFHQTVALIAEGRKLEPAQVEGLLDQAIFPATLAKEAGLIDRVAYDDQLQEQLRSELHAGTLEVTKKYGKQKRDTDFSGFAGMVKMMNLLIGTPATSRRSSKPKIAVIYAVGIIMTGKSTDTLFGISMVGSETLVKAIRKAADDPQVSAIVLRVDSPGGSALASDLIWHEIVRTEKPVVASMSDTAASGGYYISMGADKIFAEPGTLTGSIGVVGGKLALEGLFEKIGITTEIVSRGKNSGVLSPTTPFTDSEREVWLRMMTDTYEQFVTKAAQGRKMDRPTLDPLAQGRIWTGRAAAENGLVDAIGTLDDAIAEAKQLAGMRADDDVDLMILPKPVSIFEQMFGLSDVEAKLKRALPEAFNRLGEVELLRRLFQEPSVLLLPYRLQIK